MCSVSYRYNPNTTNPYWVCKQSNPNIHYFYLVYKKRNHLFPNKFWFGWIIRIWYTPTIRWTLLSSSLISSIVLASSFILGAFIYCWSLHLAIFISKINNWFWFGFLFLEDWHSYENFDCQVVTVIPSTFLIANGVKLLAVSTLKLRIKVSICLLTWWC